jgi:catechol 2,3-dioxygenase
LEDGYFGTRNGRLVIERADGTPSDGREPLDLEALFSHLTPEDRLDAPLPPDLSLGHVHLYGNNLEAHMRFYRDVLGFGNTTWIPSFRMGDVSPNDKPHMIAFNAWQGESAPPAPPNALGIRYYTIVLPDQSELERVTERVRLAGYNPETTLEGLLLRDPAQIGVVLTAV